MLCRFRRRLVPVPTYLCMDACRVLWGEFCVNCGQKAQLTGMSDACRAAWRWLNGRSYRFHSFRSSASRGRPDCFLFIADLLARNLLTNCIIIFRTGTVSCRSSIKMHSKSFLCSSHWFVLEYCNSFNTVGAMPTSLVHDDDYKN